MTWGKEYHVKDKDQLCDVVCPNDSCQHHFQTAVRSLHREFTCKKCGTEWYGGLKDD